jgi:hypothetical protein
MTGHLIISTGLTHEQITEIKHTFKHEMDELNIGHCTIEIENELEVCIHNDC